MIPIFRKHGPVKYCQRLNKIILNLPVFFLCLHGPRSLMIKRTILNYNCILVAKMKRSSFPIDDATHKLEK